MPAPSFAIKQRARAVYRRKALILFVSICIIFEGYIYNELKANYLIEMSIVRFALAAAIGYLLVFSNGTTQEHYRNLQISVIGAMIIFPVLIWMMAYASLGQLNWISQEDGIFENLSAAALFLATLIFLIMCASHIKNRLKVKAAITALAAALFFVLGMEEISWMQRVLEIESSDFFEDNNAQHETNLHNFNSILSNNIYATGAFLLLTVAPYARRHAARMIEKLGLSQAKDLLPAAWLLLPFAVIAGFVFPAGYNGPVLIFIYTLTMWMLVGGAKRAYDQQHWLRAASYAVIGIVTSATLGVCLFNTASYASNTFYEIREFLIAVGVLVYSVEVWLRHALPSKKGIDSGW